MLQRWRGWARRVKRETYALALAYRDPRTPWYARAVAAIVVAYAFSPLDLIPDVIPVLGYLDDLILVPLGILLAVRLIPAPRPRRRARARRTPPGQRPAGEPRGGGDHRRHLAPRGGALPAAHPPRARVVRAQP